MGVLNRIRDLVCSAVAFLLGHPLLLAFAVYLLFFDETLPAMASTAAETLNNMLPVSNTSTQEAINSSIVNSVQQAVLNSNLISYKTLSPILGACVFYAIVTMVAKGGDGILGEVIEGVVAFYLVCCIIPGNSFYPGSRLQSAIGKGIYGTYNSSQVPPGKSLLFDSWNFLASQFGEILKNEPELVNAESAANTSFNNLFNSILAINFIAINCTMPKTDHSGLSQQGSYRSCVNIAFTSRSTDALAAEKAKDSSTTSSSSFFSWDSFPGIGLIRSAVTWLMNFMAAPVGIALTIILWILRLFRNVLMEITMLSFNLSTSIGLLFSVALAPFAVVPSLRGTYWSAIKKPMSMSMFSVVAAIFAWVSSILSDAITHAAQNSILDNIDRFTEGSLVQVEMTIGIAAVSVVAMQISIVRKLPEITTQLWNLSLDAVISLGGDMVKQGVGLTSTIVQAGSSILGPIAGGFVAAGSLAKTGIMDGVKSRINSMASIGGGGGGKPPGASLAGGGAAPASTASGSNASALMDGVSERRAATGQPPIFGPGSVSPNAPLSQESSRLLDDSAASFGGDPSLQGTPGSAPAGLNIPQAGLASRFVQAGQAQPAQAPAEFNQEESPEQLRDRLRGQSVMSLLQDKQGWQGDLARSLAAKQQGFSDRVNAIRSRVDQAKAAFAEKSPMAAKVASGIAQIGSAAATVGGIAGKTAYHAGGVALRHGSGMAGRGIMAMLEGKDASQVIQAMNVNSEALKQHIGVSMENGQAVYHDSGIAKTFSSGVSEAIARRQGLGNKLGEDSGDGHIYKKREGNNQKLVEGSDEKSPEATKEDAKDDLLSKIQSGNHQEYIIEAIKKDDAETITFAMENGVDMKEVIAEGEDKGKSFEYLAFSLNVEKVMDAITKPQD